MQPLWEAGGGGDQGWGEQDVSLRCASCCSRRAFGVPTVGKESMGWAASPLLTPREDVPQWRSWAWHSPFS